MRALYIFKLFFIQLAHVATKCSGWVKILGSEWLPSLSAEQTPGGVGMMTRAWIEIERSLDSVVVGKDKPGMSHGGMSSFFGVICGRWNDCFTAGRTWNIGVCFAYVVLYSDAAVLIGCKRYMTVREPASEQTWYGNPTKQSNNNNKQCIVRSINNLWLASAATW